jgi:hypothetical protein
MLRWGTFSYQNMIQQYMKDEKEGFDLSRLQMNKVGREDAAAEVLKPKLDTATKTRNLMLISVVAIAVLGILIVQFARSGKVWESPEDKANHQFAPGEQSFKQE